MQTSLNPFNSDHVAFIVHSAADTVDRIDYELALEILRMNAKLEVSRRLFLNSGARFSVIRSIQSWGV